MTPEERRGGHEVFVRVLGKLPLTDLYALACSFPGCSTETWEHQSDEGKREEIAANIFRTVEEMDRRNNRLGELVGALRTLGVPTGW